ncbi:MAG: nucleotidyltransferase family protein [Myxococcaceae bacterium]
MILAAGLGTRLRPLTLKTPKPLIELNGKPLIAYALEYMVQAGVKKIAINTHYLAEQIPKALGSNYQGIPITYLYEPEILGTGGGLKNACDNALGYDEPIFLMNSDIAVQLDLPGFLKAHEEARPAVTLLLKTVSKSADYVEIGTDSQNYVRGMIGLIPYEGPKLLERLFCGTHLISAEALAHLPASKSFGIVDSFYVPLVKAGFKILGVEQKGHYSDLGTLESLREAGESLTKL